VVLGGGSLIRRSMSDANPFTIARLMALIGFDCKITSAFNA